MRFDSFFYFIKAVFIPWRYKGYCCTCPSGAAGSSDAMNIAFGILRDIIIKDMRYPFDVQATGSNIGGN